MDKAAGSATVKEEVIMAAPEASIIPQLEEAVSKVRKDIESIPNRDHLS